MVLVSSPPSNQEFKGISSLLPRAFDSNHASLRTSNTRISCFCANRSNCAPCRLDFSPASSQITTAFRSSPCFSGLRKKSSTVVAWAKPSFRNTCAADAVGVMAKIVCSASLNPRCTSRSVVVFPAPATPRKLYIWSRVSRIEATVCFCSSDRCPAGTNLEFNAGQESFVASTYFTAHCSSSKPCSVQHSESSGFSAGARRTSPASPLVATSFNFSKSSDPSD